MNNIPKNYRAFYKPDEKIYNVWAIKYENGNRTVAIKDDFVKSSDIILMEGSDKKDIKGREIFEGDIVQIIKPIDIFRAHGYEKEAFNSFGYVYYDSNKKIFMWAGFTHGSWPQFALSGKDYLIVGNVFHDTEIFLDKEKFNITGMGNKLGSIYCDWLKNRKFSIRYVLFEKNQYLKLKDKEYKLYLEKRKMRDSFRNEANKKREERYKKIYYDMKEKLESGVVKS